MHRKHPLRWFLLVWLGAVYLQELTLGLGGPRTPLGPRLLTGNLNPTLVATVAFTLLMLLHIALHCSILFYEPKPRWVLPYFLIQGLLAILMLYLADAQDAVFGLCLALTLEAIHILKWSRQLVFVVSGLLGLYILALDPINYFTNAQLQIFSYKLLNAMTLIFFIIACVILYRQQAMAHKTDQELLHELAATYAKLEKAHIQLENYAVQVEDLTLVTERQRLARELHDTLAQSLVALTLQLETIDSLIARQHTAQAQTIVQQAMARARATMAEARSAIDDLRVATPNSEQFNTVLQEMVQRFTATNGIPCLCTCTQFPVLPSASQEQILRIISEALTNTARHAHATQSWINTTYEQGMLTLEIGDNGIGFDPQNVTSQTGHYGLLGLRERVQLLSGQIAVISTLGQGSIIRICIPGVNGGVLV
ncbi:MAG TPA: sensor histidine kinase [Ktedonobacteraceae bacterium]|jgi:NarL family two-component system sensor histidine kinase YdfH|nr:sensor histidine kinase [Ktedonobacteraceae bacterium]